MNGISVYYLTPFSCKRALLNIILNHTYLLSLHLIFDNQHGRTPLMAAIINRKIEVMSLLIEGGANINAIARVSKHPLIFYDVILFITRQ